MVCRRNWLIILRFQLWAVSCLSGSIQLLVLCVCRWRRGETRIIPQKQTDACCVVVVFLYRRVKLMVDGGFVTMIIFRTRSGPTGPTFLLGNSIANHFWDQSWPYLDKWGKLWRLSWLNVTETNEVHQPHLRKHSLIVLFYSKWTIIY